jgi:hypothetical protein
MGDVRRIDLSINTGLAGQAIGWLMIIAGT